MAQGLVSYVVCDFVNQSRHCLTFSYRRQSSILIRTSTRDLRVSNNQTNNVFLEPTILLDRASFLGLCFGIQKNADFLCKPEEWKNFYLTCVTQLGWLSLPLSQSRVAIIWNPFPVAVTRSQYRTLSIVKLGSNAKSQVRKQSSPSFHLTMIWNE